MPIRPENRGRYPADWADISARIKFDRAGGRCECEGECGRGTHKGRCPNRHHHPAYGSGSRVVLTTAHLNHQPEDCSDDNLRAMCQGCHLHYDRAHHAETRATTKQAALAAQMNPLFEEVPVVPDLDLTELRRSTRNLVYLSDGTSGSEKLGRIVDAFPKLLDAAQQIEDLQAAARWLVQWNDERQVPTDIRILKITEEAGEAAQSYLGWQGANPRKGITCEVEDVHTELADVAISAIVALATLHADPVAALLNRSRYVVDRLRGVS